MGCERCRIIIKWSQGTPRSHDQKLHTSPLLTAFTLASAGPVDCVDKFFCSPGGAEKTARGRVEKLWGTREVASRYHVHPGLPTTFTHCVLSRPHTPQAALL